MVTRYPFWSFNSTPLSAFSPHCVSCSFPSVCFSLSVPISASKDVNEARVPFNWSQHGQQCGRSVLKAKLVISLTVQQPLRKRGINQQKKVHCLKFEILVKSVLPSCVCVCTAQSLQLCPTLCNPVDCSPPGSSVHGIMQARIQEWVAIPFSRGSSWPRDWIPVSCIAGRFFTIWATRTF